MSAHELALEVTTLFSLPAVTTRLNQLLRSPLSTNSDIGEVIINDPALTARVLRLVNTGYWGFGVKVEQVSEAIHLIGQDAIQELLLATSVANTFIGLPAELVDMERFWLNSIACGVIARSLAFRCGVFNSEPLFVAGLLHKVGRLVFFSRRAEQYQQVLAAGVEGEEAINRAEIRVFGFSHAELGAELLGSWGLSERLRASVAFYPSPGKAPKHRRSAALIHVASALAGNVEPGMTLPVLDDGISFERGAWELLGIDEHDLPKVIEEAWIQAFEVLDIIRPKPN